MQVTKYFYISGCLLSPHSSNTQANTWTGIFKQPGTSWQEQAGPFVLDATTWLYGAPSGLFLTTDHGATWTDVTPSKASFGGGEVDSF